MYMKEIEKIKKEIENKEEIKKIEDGYKKDKDQYLYWISLLNYVSKKQKKDTQK